MRSGKRNFNKAGTICGYCDQKKCNNRIAHAIKSGQTPDGSSYTKKCYEAEYARNEDRLDAIKTAIIGWGIFAVLVVVLVVLGFVLTNEPKTAVGFVVEVIPLARVLIKDSESKQIYARNEVLEEKIGRLYSANNAGFDK